MNMSFTKMKCIETPDVTLITSGTPPPEVSKVKAQNQPSLIQTFESVENPNPLLWDVENDIKHLLLCLTLQVMREGGIFYGY